MFLKKSVLEGGIPFDAKIDQLTLNAFLSVDKMRTASENNGNAEMSLDEINEEIKSARIERKKQTVKHYAVIDTNVIVSSMLKHDSIPGKILDLVILKRIVPLLSSEIVDEYEEVLRRNKFGFANSKPIKMK